ncbi:hypothetical protein ACW7BJ_20955 [Azospirillum argentinense]
MTSPAWKIMCDRILRIWREFNHANDVIRKQLLADLDVTREKREKLIEEMTDLLKLWVTKEREVTQAVASSTAHERIEARKLFRSIVVDAERALAEDANNVRRLPYNDTTEDVILEEIGDLLDQKEMQT